MFESTRKSILQSSGATIPDLTSFKVDGFFYDRFLERGKGLVSMFASAKLAEEDDEARSGLSGKDGSAMAMPERGVESGVVRKTKAPRKRNSHE